MPDIFISYNRQDRDRARLIADTLEAEGFSVWWDAALKAGETYDEVTEKNLREAGAVVVLWSKRSVNSKWVRAEATAGERNATLVPALIEECEKPLRFELVQTADLIHWAGDREDPNWRLLMLDIKAALTKKSAPRAAAAPPAPAASPEIETTFWTSVKDSDDPSDFRSYLSRYPKGHFADLARNRIAALERAAAPKPEPRAPTPPRSQTPPPRTQTPTKAPTSAAPKSSSSLAIIAGAVIGVGAIGAVVWAMMRPAAPTHTVADVVAEIPANASESAGPAPQPREPAPPTSSDLPPAPTTNVTVEPAAEAAPESAPAPSVASYAEFRDCDECPLMRPAPAGAFTMGSPETEIGREPYEGPQRLVNIGAFAIGAFEVTNREWAACVAANACPPARTGEDNGPAVGLSWRDADNYARWLARKTGKPYRLPSEAEWEYAARAGAVSAYFWGESFDRAKVAVDKPHPVGSFPANAFGLHDMLGNAREWVADCYVNNFRAAPSDGTPVLDGDCSKRAIRGGAWTSASTDLRLSGRARIDADQRVGYMGVRIAMDLPGNGQAPGE